MAQCTGERFGDVEWREASRKVDLDVLKQKGFHRLSELEQEHADRMADFVNAFVERNKHVQTREKAQLEDFGLGANDCAL